MEKNTRKPFASVLVIVTFLLVSCGAAPVSASDSSVSGVSIGQRAQWTVIASSGVTATWYSEAFIPQGNFSLPIGSTIDLTITSITGNRFRGNISAGGLVLTDVPMTEISFNLLLGWYPFQPGLVCPINWNAQRQNATSNGFTFQMQRFGPTTAVTFDHMNGTVGTRLTYDWASGLLLHGYGSFGQFTLEIMLRLTFTLLSPTATVVIAITTIAVVVAIVGGWYGTSRKTSR